ncbi:cupin domain-containing protein [Reyranella sp.]|uniref:cupin domain-containing protein n=1 Tax=Reyranella sp. TaxID=1929291 RepID=UPI003D0F3E92
MDKPLLRRALDCRTSRIKPADTNKFVMLVDPLADKSPFISVVEIFDVGGKTPRHHHGHAHEMFYVLSGRGKAHCNGEIFDMEKGDALMLPPGFDHVVENVGPDKLYCLTVMVPNEGFAEMIRDGETMTLDAADRAVVSA